MAKGGARRGAGRPKGSVNRPQTQAIPASNSLDPLTYLLHVLRDDSADVKRRDWAAGLLLTFMHERRPSVVLPPKERARKAALSSQEQRRRDFQERMSEALKKEGYE